MGCHPVVADERLFPNYKEQIRFAALTLDDLGLCHYGECSIILNTPMICHRATVLHENAASWVRRHTGISPLPTGYRATWADRCKLAVAKLANQFLPGTTIDSFSHLLLKNGSGGNDEFIEVHIWGPMTRRTFALVIVSQAVAKSSPGLVETMSVQLTIAGVPLGVQL